ncbi:hypothetical protein BV22DRAFT_835148 [Leucogyrophana mollusca]|uniref:Uncharacterized protein n=1 Tax=Leucogyrophana mollusca TaxID=85980 RepID=A0ACB8B3G0_9AGAM|nr:hypothetical protein BV22DRAFT_835148 [Leucogyrophana mollusca]
MDSILTRDSTTPRGEIFRRGINDLGSTTRGATRVYDSSRCSLAGRLVVIYCAASLHIDVCVSDCMNLNAMMNARTLYIDPFHPCQPRLRRDFGGADKTVSEFQRSNEPRKPFQTDTHHTGNLIKKDFIQAHCISTSPKHL